MSNNIGDSDFKESVYDILGAGEQVFNGKHIVSVPTYSSSQSLHKALRDMRNEVYDIAENGASSLADLYVNNSAGSTLLSRQATTIMPLSTKPVLLAASSKEQLLVHLRGQERQLHSQAATVSKLVDKMDGATGTDNDLHGDFNRSQQLAWDAQSRCNANNDLNGHDENNRNICNVNAGAPLNPVGFARQARAMNEDLRLSTLLPPTKQSKMYNYMHKNNVHSSLRSMADNIANYNYADINELLPSQLQLLEYREERRRLTIEKYYLYRIAVEQMRLWRVRCKEFRQDRRNFRMADNQFYADKIRRLFAYLHMKIHFGAKLICVTYTRNANLQLYGLRQLKQKMENFRMVRVVELYLRSSWCLQKAWRQWCCRILRILDFHKTRAKRTRRAAAQGRNPRGVDILNINEIDEFYTLNCFRRFYNLCTWNADSKRRSRVHYIRHLYVCGLTALVFHREDRQEARDSTEFSKKVVMCRYLLRRWRSVAQRRIRCRTTDVVYRYNQVRRAWLALAGVFRRKAEADEVAQWRVYRQGMDRFYFKRALDMWRTFPAFQKSRRRDFNDPAVEHARSRYVKFKATQSIAMRLLLQLLERYKEGLGESEAASIGRSSVNRSPACSRTSSVSVQPFATSATQEPRARSSTAALFGNTSDEPDDVASGMNVPPLPPLPNMETFDGSYEEYRLQKRRRNSLIAQARVQGQLQSTSTDAVQEFTQAATLVTVDAPHLSGTVLVEQQIRAQIFKVSAQAAGGGGVGGAVAVAVAVRESDHDEETGSARKTAKYSSRQAHRLINCYRLLTVLMRHAHQSTFAKSFLQVKQAHAIRYILRQKKQVALHYWMQCAEQTRHFNLKFLIAQKNALRSRAERRKRTAMRRWVRNAKHHKYEQKLCRQRYIAKQQEMQRQWAKMTPEQIQRSKNKLLKQQPEKQFGVGKGRRYSVVLKDIMPVFLELQSLKYVNNSVTDDVVGQWQLDYHIELLQKCTQIGAHKRLKRGLFALERRTMDTLKALTAYRRAKQYYVDSMFNNLWADWKYFVFSVPPMTRHAHRVPLGYSLIPVYWKKFVKKTHSCRRITADITIAAEKHRNYQLRLGYKQLWGVYATYLRGQSLKVEGNQARDRLLVHKGMLKLRTLVRQIRVENRAQDVMDKTFINKFRLLYTYKRWRLQFALWLEEIKYQRNLITSANLSYIDPQFQRWKAHYNRMVNIGRCVQRAQTFRRRFHQHRCLCVWQAKLDDVTKRQKFLSRVGHQHHTIRLLRKLLIQWKWRATSTRIQIIDVDFARQWQYRSEDSIYWVTNKLRQFIRRMNQNATFFRERRARRKFTYKKLYGNFMSHLSNYGLSRTICSSSLAVAHDYRLRRMGSNVLNHFRHYADISLIYKYMKATAADFRKTRLLRMTFDAWFRDMKSCEHLYESADSYYASAGASKSFLAIRSRNQVVEWMLNLEGQAANAHARYGAHLVLECFRQYILLRREEYALNHFAESNFLSSSTYRGFDRWHAIHTANSVRKYKEMECLLHFHSRLLHVGFLNWSHRSERNIHLAKNVAFGLLTYTKRKYKRAMTCFKRRYGPKKLAWNRKVEVKLGKYVRAKLRNNLDRVIEFTHNSRDFHSTMQLARYHFKTVHTGLALRIIRRHRQLGARKQRTVVAEVSEPHYSHRLTTTYFSKFANLLSVRIVSKEKRSIAVEEMVRFKMLRAFCNWKKFKDERNRSRRRAVMNVTAVGKGLGAPGPIGVGYNSESGKVVKSKINKITRMQHRIKAAIANSNIGALSDHSDIIDRERHGHILFAVRSLFAVRRWKASTDRKGAVVMHKFDQFAQTMAIINATNVFHNFGEIARQQSMIGKAMRHFAIFQFKMRFVKHLKSLIRCRRGFEAVTLKRTDKVFKRWQHRRKVSANSKALVKRVLHQRVYQKQIDMFDEWVLITHIERELAQYLLRKLHSDQLLALFKLFQHVQGKKVGRFCRNNLIIYEEKGRKEHVRYRQQFVVNKLKALWTSKARETASIKLGKEGLRWLHYRRVLDRLKLVLAYRTVREERKRRAESLPLRRGMLALDGFSKDKSNRRTETRNVDAYRAERLLQHGWENLHASIDYSKLDASVSRNWAIRHRRHQLRRAIQQLDALRCARWSDRHQNRLMDGARVTIVSKLALKWLYKNVLNRRKKRTRRRKAELARSQQCQSRFSRLPEEGSEADGPGLGPSPSSALSGTVSGAETGTGTATGTATAPCYPAWMFFTDADYPEEDSFDDGEDDAYAFPKHYDAPRVDVHKGYRPRSVSAEPSPERSPGQTNKNRLHSPRTSTMGVNNSPNADAAAADVDDDLDAAAIGNAKTGSDNESESSNSSSSSSSNEEEISQEPASAPVIDRVDFDINSDSEPNFDIESESASGGVGADFTHMNYVSPPFNISTPPSSSAISDHRNTTADATMQPVDMRAAANNV